MKLGQLIEYTRELLFFKNYAENKAGELFPDLIFIKKKKKALNMR